MYLGICWDRGLTYYYPLDKGVEVLKLALVVSFTTDRYPERIKPIEMPQLKLLSEADYLKLLKEEVLT